MTKAAQSEQTFVLTIGTEDITVRYRPNYISGHDPYAMLEFTSPHEPRRRITGRPRMAALFLVAYAAIVVGWCEGSVTWWLALAAMLAAAQTLSAVGQMRRYNAWVAQWQAMGEPLSRPPQPPKQPRLRWALVTVAALLFVGIPAHLSQVQSADGWQSDSDGQITALVLLWCAVSLYLVFKIIRGIVRRMTKRRTANTQIATRAEATPVTWLVGAPSSAPARRNAAKELPEYCARLMMTQHHNHPDSNIMLDSRGS